MGFMPYWRPTDFKKESMPLVTLYKGQGVLPLAPSGFQGRKGYSVNDFMGKVKQLT